METDFNFKMSKTSDGKVSDVDPNSKLVSKDSITIGPGLKMEVRCSKTPSRISVPSLKIIKCCEGTSVSSLIIRLSNVARVNKNLQYRSKVRKR